MILHILYALLVQKSCVYYIPVISLIKIAKLRIKKEGAFKEK
jgi:hypothetical protein